MAPQRPKEKRTVRYAVVGLGHIAQVAVLPAFDHAENSELAALVSSDSTKLKTLSRRHGVETAVAYDQFAELCASGTIDAAYIALPNHLHREYTEIAANAGIHVLCEKPMALTTKDAEAMIRTCARNGVRLMIAYRLHFERANLEAVDIVSSGTIGEPRFFSSDFSLDVKAGDIRVRRETGGGALWDLGIYCVNAARYLFQAEPLEAVAFTAARDDERFREVEEMLGAILRFPGERLAHFTCSLGAADLATYRVVGTKGDLVLNPAYEYAIELERELTVGGKKSHKKFPKRDQFAPELVTFSDCVLEGRDPEPSGEEGLLDVRVIEALYRSARTGKAVELSPREKGQRPTLDQEMRRPPVSPKPKEVKAKPPSRG
jgi:glucose-fructose oxidoreductase